MRRLLPLALFPFLTLCGLPGTALGAPRTAGTADTVYRNGHIYTADKADHVHEAVAIRAGRIVYAGSSAGVARLIGSTTRVVDLHGRFAMPGLIDAHMHPLEGGTRLLRCNLNYERLTVPQFQERIQACLDAERNHEPDSWMEVVSWFQQGMLPAGVSISHATIDGLHTTRPILVHDSFGHTVLANNRALALAGITRATPDPAGGKFDRDANGEPNGLLEDAAFEPFEHLIPTPSPAQNLSAARAALLAMAKQGVTSALDADAQLPTLDAFAVLDRGGELTARMHFAMHIDTTDDADPATAVARVVDARQRFDRAPLEVTPHLTVRNAKLYLDGVISGPAFTGAMIEPYRINTGTATSPHWQPGTDRGPAVYHPAPVLADILTRLARAGIDPHMHADGDLAVRAGLDGIAAMRKAVPHKDIRPAIAHDESVAQADFPRYRTLGTFPVLSFQWEKPAPDTVDQLRDYFGPERAAIVEPAGLLQAAGAPVAFGSDWPVDTLNEWFALKVAVTRTNAPDSGYTGRLGIDPGLTRLQALRAATIVAARALHQDREAGSLEPGKFADMIVLDRDPMQIAPEDIANVRVLETIVGGRTVYSVD